MLTHEVEKLNDCMCVNPEGITFYKRMPSLYGDTIQKIIGLEGISYEETIIEHPHGGILLTILICQRSRVIVKNSYILTLSRVPKGRSLEIHTLSRFEDMRSKTLGDIALHGICNIITTSDKIEEREKKQRRRAEKVGGILSIPPDNYPLTDYIQREERMKNQMMRQMMGINPPLVPLLKEQAFSDEPPEYEYKPRFKGSFTNVLINKSRRLGATEFMKKMEEEYLKMQKEQLIQLEKEMFRYRGEVNTSAILDAINDTNHNFKKLWEEHPFRKELLLLL